MRRLLIFVTVLSKPFQGVFYGYFIHSDFRYVMLDIKCSRFECKLIIHFKFAAFKMRSLIVLCLMVAVASAQQGTASVGKASGGCDFGVPSFEPGPDFEPTWRMEPCDQINSRVVQLVLREGAELLGVSFLVSLL